MPTTPLSARRALLKGGAGLIAATATPAWLTPALAQGKDLRPTPAQTEGPYYPVAFPADTDFDLLRNGAAAYGKGQPAWVMGTVTDTRGTPLAGGVIEIWQCDQDGHYHHPGDGGKADPAFQGFGKVTLGRDGGYRFRTLQPAPYSGRTPHIHVKIKLGGRELLTTQFYVQGDPGNARDFLWRRLGEEGQAALTRPFVKGSDGLKAEYAVVVET
ncbi:dioxygenase family protein [Hydrogenophaga pseudoflava]|uniref:dioxygenase family protein n=1 Tax=Hydrogenophaga pseudoflava TaxID=47421 RepID=UPI0027E3DD9A|nr:intradiol ring-cleavage dioxygenase [Hydrogenophaga pseudoflava]MDQ7745284.1 intradiol ring-cleavage dioxygenase [Hydrogenophaga pseudoflava]